MMMMMMTVLLSLFCFVFKFFHKGRHLVGEAKPIPLTISVSLVSN